MKIKTKDNISGISIKSLDMQSRTIEGYGSVFDNKDSDGDIIRKGSYRKTIQESGPAGKDRIAHLYQHDMRQPLGKFVELYEDEKGLVFVSKMPDTSLANDVMKLYEAGILKEHSVGFQIMKGSRRDENTPNEYYEISEIKLYEVSTVTLAANELAGMKSMDKLDKLQWLSSEMKSLTDAIRKGSFTDSTFELLAAKLDDYTAEYHNIIDSLSKPEPVQTTEEKQEKPKPEIQVNLLETFYAGFKSL